MKKTIERDSRFKGRKLILKRNRQVRKRYTKEQGTQEEHKRIMFTRVATGQDKDKTQ